MLAELVKRNPSVLSMKMQPFERNLLHRSVLVLRDEAVMESVHMLKTLGIGLDDQDELGKTALHYAAATGMADVVASLLQGRASVDVIDRGGNTALLLSLLPTVSELLLNAGANANHQNNVGNTALHTACAFGMLELKVPFCLSFLCPLLCLWCELY